MQDADRSEFAGLITSLALSFGVQVEAALLRGYWMGLGDIPLEGLERAVGRALRECKHMPRPIDLRALSGEMPAAARAIRAWAAASDAMTRVGAYRSVDFDDPLTNATLRALGGWTRLCGQTTEEAEKWTAKEFQRVYTALLRDGVTEEASAHLPGITEQQRLLHGHEPEPPKPIETGLDPVQRIGGRVEATVRQIAGTS